MTDARTKVVSKIVPNLYLTGANGVTEENIRNHNIKLVINSAIELPKTDYTDALTYKLSLYDRPNESINAYLDWAADTIHHYVSKNESVLIHCYMGISRSATLVIAYLIKYKKMSVSQAVSFCQSIRPIVNPNSGFLKQLDEFEKTSKNDSIFTNSSSSSSPTTTYYSSSSGDSSYTPSSSDYERSNSYSDFIYKRPVSTYSSY